ncbi:MAG: DMT family transporter [Bacteroidales bacterium]|nr:DMT family transporter [Bacteroidales bacterium]
MSTKVKGYSLAITTSVTFGMIPLFAIPLKQMNFSFDTALFYRFMISAVMIGLYLVFTKMDLKVTRKELGTLIFLGVVYSCSSEFLFLGYDYMSAGVASTILFMYPVMVALIMGFGFKEKISRIVWIAILLAFSGVMVLNGSGDGKMSPLGLLIILLSTLSYAVYMVLVNKSNVRNMQGIKITFYSIAFSSLFFLFKSFIRGTFQAIPSVEVAINISLFGLITTAISLITLVYSIKLIGSTPTAILGSMEPMVAVAISVILFHEAFTLNLAVGIVLVMTAVVLTILSDNLEKWFSHAKNLIQK